MIIGASPIKNGNVFKEFPPCEYYVICADGGYETAKKYGITPDLIVGDFDSLKEPPVNESIKVKVLPVKKDVTDTMYAALVAIKNGIRNFVLIGCTGGNRQDHTVANYNVMLYIARKSGAAIMADDSSKTFLLGGSRLKITEQKGSTVSVFPFGTNSCCVTYKGLKYPLHEHDLIMGDTLMGVSNEVLEDFAQITVHSGFAMIILFNKKMD